MRVVPDVDGGPPVEGCSVKPFFESSDVTIFQADSREAWKHLPEHSVDAIVTSPPYFGLRDYGVDGQVGLEDNPQEYVDDLADLLTGYGSRVLKPGGSLWLNLGDTYSNTAAGWDNKMNERREGGSDDKQRAHEDRMKGRKRGVDFPSKCLLMIPERVALALIARGWILRNRVVWAKPNGMPSSVTDRLSTKHEALFHLVRQPRYYYDLDAIREPHSTVDENGNIVGWGKPATTDWRERANNGATSAAGLGLSMMGGHPSGKNPGDVWTIPTQPYPDAHFAVFPPELVRRPILATVPEGGTVLDPFFGSGTTAVMARKLGRKAVGVELNPDYCRLAADRFRQDVLTFDEEVSA